MQTPESLLQAAEQLVPDLAERALEAETLRHAPEASVKAMREAGLARVLQPTRFGGAGLPLRTQVEISATLARGCTSTAWCHFVWGVHQFLVGLLPEAGQQEVWGPAPETLISASISPVGRYTREGDDVRLGGHWSFASGCDWADWLILGAQPAEGGEGLPILAVVPKSETEIVDNWFVAGLKGTGSKDVVVGSVSVPARRVIRFPDVLPHFPLLTVVLNGPILGGAERAVELFTRRMVDRALITGGRQRDRGTAKGRLAESSAEVFSARLLVERVCAEIDQGPVAPEVAERQLRDCGFAAKLCVRAVQRIFEASGGTSLQESNPIQRIWRDVTAGSTHAYLTWDTQAEGYADAVLARATEAAHQ